MMTDNDMRIMRMGMITECTQELDMRLKMLRHQVARDYSPKACQELVDACLGVSAEIRELAK